MAGKTHCTSERPACARCTKKGLPCEYSETQVPPSKTSAPPASGASPTVPPHDLESLPGDYSVNAFLTPEPTEDRTPSIQTSYNGIEALTSHGGVIPYLFQVEDPVVQPMTSSVADSENHIQCLTPLGDRWPTDRFLFEPDSLQSHWATVHAYRRILESYPQKLSLIDTVPPFVHRSQLAVNPLATPLANGLQLAKVMSSNLTSSSDVSRRAVQSEVQRLQDDFFLGNVEHLLEAVQMLLLYSITTASLLGPNASQSTSYMENMINLLRMGYDLGRMGLILEEERNHTRPRFADWIRVCARRRALLTLYCVDTAYLTTRRMIYSTCNDLASIRAPLGKALWEAPCEDEWRKAYNRWIVRWEDGPFTVGEIMKKPVSANAQSRLQRWLAETDEFGMMLFIAASGTWTTTSGRTE